MKIIYNSKIIPFKRFRAIYLFGVLLVRGSGPLTESTINHELTHDRQCKEMLFVFFYLWYCIEWIVRIFQYGIGDAYYLISFEREAYSNQDNIIYLESRKRFEWIKYLKN